ncbi:hypothetical protein A1O1_03321 [Capronia coronata CBS 617.96]|uniref:Uncharacterized protein n=1 Tax=Capronia coronata CBS 617.96 TaxID=1182541 RepID=W9YBH9_9EURO|nr:uncharacterized protein A1O1_03321 [Capronia coronata CBS 617.96]EXJ90222.1 hypothetical protein A1O1_03321 [Capronia coronata CBS 617.96]
MFTRWSLIIGLVVIVALSAGAWFLSPKGENQTYGSPYPSPSNGTPMAPPDRTADGQTAARL